MEFWIKQDSNGALQLPVKPTEFNVTVTHINTAVNVIQLGEINLMGRTGLREIALSSFFPAKDYNFSINISRQSPIACVNQIEGWRNSGKPVRVIITDLLNMEATIESFTWGERDATGDIYYTMAIKEYKKIKTKKATVTIATVKPTVRETKPADTGKTYTVKKGDCLWNIAKAFYGDGSKYPQIYSANKALIDGRNKGTGLPQYTIYAGQVFTIP